MWKCSLLGIYRLLHSSSRTLWANARRSGGSLAKPLYASDKLDAVGLTAMGTKVMGKTK